MYNPNNRQYILKQSNDKVWNFFYDDKYGLCYSLLTKRNTWTDPVPLSKNLQKSFYADVDFDDIFHILFQDAQGNIFYSRLDNQAVTTKPVLNSKTPTPYDKHLYLVPLKNNINVFYVVAHDESMILAHQTINDNTLSSPRVVDFVQDKEHPYSIVCDKSGNMYAIYQSSDGKHLQLGYKRYTPGQKNWGEFTPITKYSGDCGNPQSITDSSNIIHICYQRRTNREYELVYQQKVPDKNIWSGEAVIHSSIYPFDNSSVSSINGKLIIHWVRDDIVFHSSSTDGGSTWSKPSRLNYPMGKQLFCMSFKSNTTHEYEKIITPYIPGSFINGLRLGFYHDALSTSSANISAEELKNMLLDSLKLLNTGMEELKEANSGIDENIARLNTTNQNLEKELVKHSVKLGVLENETSQLKLLNSKLESYRNTISGLQSKMENAGVNLDMLKNQISANILESEAFREQAEEIKILRMKVAEMENCCSMVKSLQSKADNPAVNVSVLKSEIIAQLSENKSLRKQAEEIKTLRKEVSAMRNDLDAIIARLEEEEE